MPPKFTVPLGPVIPVLASIVALGILAGATRQQLISGVAALAAGAVLFQVELSFEGVEDRLDELAEWFEQVLAWPRGVDAVVGA